MSRPNKSLLPHSRFDAFCERLCLAAGPGVAWEARGRAGGARVAWPRPLASVVYNCRCLSLEVISLRVSACRSGHAPNLLKHDTGREEPALGRSVRAIPGKQGV